MKEFIVNYGPVALGVGLLVLIGVVAVLVSRLSQLEASYDALVGPRKPITSRRTERGSMR